MRRGRAAGLAFGVMLALVAGTLTCAGVTCTNTGNNAPDETAYCE